MLSSTSLGLGQHIRRCVAGADLDSGEMREAMGFIMDGQATAAQLSALLVALCVKGETPQEIVGAAQAMRERAVPIRCARRPLMDVCGTGGDGSGSFNISTAVAFVVAGAGVAVAKHGNRAMSSRSGSADVLEALGVDITLPPVAWETTLERHGIAFLFAQTYHPAMRVVAPVRQEIGIRTLFNMLGPLTNPAAVTHQIVGVAHERTLPLMARALRSLGSRRAAVVHADDGMDEVSLSCCTRIVEWNGTDIVEYAVEPEMLGVKRRAASEIAGSDPQANAKLIEHVLAGGLGPHRDVVLLNAALALYIAGAADDVYGGFRLAQRSIDTGAAGCALQALREARP